MQLTQKDKEFIETLRRLIDEKQLRIELVDNGVKHLVLRQNYGDKIEKSFNMTRQGVRWRFQRLLNEVYVEAYERILWLESAFGPNLRAHAVAIAKERAEMRRRILEQQQRTIAG